MSGSTDIADRVIARTVFRIVDRSFNDVEKSERRCFRIKNLSTPTIQEFLKVWSENAAGKGHGDVRVVIAGDSDRAFPETYRADPGCSITYYRNNNNTGLVYVETKTESDEQGLKNIFTLRDSNFLDESFDGDAFNVKRTMIRYAWEECNPQGKSLPDHFVRRLLEVLKLIHPRDVQVSTRKFAAFTVAACRDWLGVGGIIDPKETDRLVGRNLIELDMFPDEEWRSSDLIPRITRRLVMNSLHADLSSGPSTDLDPEACSELSLKIRFKDQKGIEYPSSELREWQKLCSQYCLGPSAALRAKIPYRIFEQLFVKDTKGLKLGDRVEQEILAAGNGRIHEYESLGVKTGLNRRSQEDAQRFLDAVPADDKNLELKALLTNQTLKLVERVAKPNSELFENPLIKLAEVASTLRERAAERDGRYILQIALGRDFVNSPSVGLFSFIYGSTLRLIVQNSRDGASTMELQVADQLLEIVAPPSVVDDQDDEDVSAETESDANQEIEWKPIAIEFRLISKDDGAEVDSESGFEWSPSQLEWMVFFWLIVAGEDRPESGSVICIDKDTKLEKWISDTTTRQQRIDQFAEKLIFPSHDALIKKAAALRNTFLHDAANEGLSSRLLNGVFDDWQQLIVVARTEIVPNGNVDQRLDALLSMDTLRVAESSVIALASHPFKLRWLANYLAKSEELANKALDGELPLNSENQNLYLNWIGSLSSLQQPAVMIGPDRKILFSSGSAGWFEIFESLSGDEQPSNISAFDQLSLQEIVRQIVGYLDSHPFKKDGFSVLLILPTGSELPSQLVQTIRKGDWRDVTISMHVLAPRKNWEEIASNFEKIANANRMSEGVELFPPLELKLYDLKSGSFHEIFSDVPQVDVAIVPQFLSDKITIQENTEPNLEIEGQFQPLIDDPTFISGGYSGSSVAVHMRPKASDIALNAWSTLVVRHHRTTPVSAQQPQNIDFIEIRIDFDESSKLFSLLHDRAHWVMTLEQHITRDQIENLESKPDVLMVLDGVGTNGLYKLIVSSNSGRKFIIERLERKLSQLLGSSPQIDRELAKKIYEHTRKLAPRLTLRATGVSRATEEILGLMVARNVASVEFPVAPKDGMVIWLALDEHPSWFKGNSGIMADFCRIVFERKGGELTANFLIVEGKLRQSYDPHGEDQVSRTLKLFNGFMPSAEDQQPIDAELWREELLKAVENLSPDAREAFGACSDEMINNGLAMPMSLRNQFRDGNFHVGGLNGLYSICLHTQSGSILRERTSDKKILILKTFKNDLLRLVDPREKFSGAGARDEVGASMPRTSAPSATKHAESSSVKSSSSKIETAKSEETGVRSKQEVEPQLPKDSDDISIDVQAPISNSSAERPKLASAELQNRYQKILDLFGEFGISVHAPTDKSECFVEGPATVLYRLKPGEAVDPKRIYEKSDALKLALALDQEQNIKFEIDKGFVTIDVPKNDADRYFVATSDLWQRWTQPPGALATPIGEDRYGHVVSINFSSANSPHLLIGGTTGSGKSEALNTILTGLCRNYTQSELKLLLVDPKGTELQGFANSEHLHGQIGWDENDAKILLVEAVEQMQSRYEKFKDKKTRSLQEFNSSVSSNERLPWWLVVLDEYADLTSDPESKKDIEASLKRLAQKARAAGIHVIIATQKPSAEVISTNLRSNLPAQLALRVKSSTESRVIMDEAGAESLNGKGDAFLKSEGRLTRVQCAIVK